MIACVLLAAVFHVGQSLAILRFNLSPSPTMQLITALIPSLKPLISAKHIKESLTPAKGTTRDDIWFFERGVDKKEK